MKEFLKEFSCYEIKTTGILSALGRNEVQRNVLSALDEIILNKLCSDNWKYVAYGIAKK